MRLPGASEQRVVHSARLVCARVPAAMFEAKVAAILNQQLGAFVTGLDASALNIAVWSGQIVLENLQARLLTIPCICALGPAGRSQPGCAGLRWKGGCSEWRFSPFRARARCPHASRRTSRSSTQLRPEALNALKLPITVTVRSAPRRCSAVHLLSHVHLSRAGHLQAGLLGKLTLKVPWKRLGRRAQPAEPCAAPVCVPVA